MSCLDELRKRRDELRAKCEANKAYDRELFEEWFDAMRSYSREEANVNHPEASTVTVARWCPWHEAEALPENPDTQWHHDALIKAILDGGYAFTGSDHQSDGYCVPVFSDGTAFTGSMRTWGGIMAEAHNHGTYVDWAWVMPDGFEVKFP